MTTGAALTISRLFASIHGLAASIARQSHLCHLISPPAGWTRSSWANHDDEGTDLWQGKGQGKGQGQGHKRKPRGPLHTNNLIPY